MNVSQDVSTKGSLLFNVDPASLHSLGGVDGAVYSCRQGSRAVVIKFLPLNANEEKAQTEITCFEEKLEFIQYLAGNDVPVAAPLTSVNNRLYERVQGEEAAYLVVLTARADGRNPTARNAYDWTERLFHAWGQVTGRMHALARRYPRWEKPLSLTPSSPATTISDWTDEYRFFPQWCKEEKIVEQWHKLHAVLQALPRSRANFGLIHNDLHQWNLFYNPEANSPLPVTVIDFDVCAYHWYLSDVATALYHATNDGPPRSLAQRTSFARQFLGPYLRGYCLESELEQDWLQNLPIFLRYREILNYIFLSNQWPKDKRARWQNAVLSGIRRRILTGEPVISALY